MLQFRRTFETEKLQLQELNKRLSQYLSRVKQLEQENAFLITEIRTIRQQRTVEGEHQHMAELRELRKTVGQLALEKSRAEMEREKLWREFQLVQALCCEESGVCKDIHGDMQGCERDLNQALKKNAALEERLFQLQDEYKSLEDIHRRDMVHLREQVHCSALPVFTQKYQGPPALTMEEVEEYALTLSESWMETFDVYRKRVEDLEESIRLDERTLEDLRREKMQCASEFEKLRAEADRQGQLQIQLEDELIHLQDNFVVQLDQYQVTIEQLEEERKALAAVIAEKLKDHQELMQVKMGLSLEVAAYRALLEGERRDLWTDQSIREAQRTTDMRKPVHTYTAKQFVSRQDGRKQYPITPRPEVRYKEQAPIVNTASRSSQFRSYGVTESVPVSVSSRVLQSSTARRDIPSFVKASQISTASKTDLPQRKSTEIQKKIIEEQTVNTKNVANATVNLQGLASASRTSSGLSPTADKKSTVEEIQRRMVKVTSPSKIQEESRGNVKDIKIVTIKSKEENKYTWESEIKPHKDVKQTVPEYQQDMKNATIEERILDTISMQEILDKVVKPAGLETMLSSSPDSKITYHIEKIKGGDGKMKTEIVLESKVQENLDISDDSVLDELLNKGVKKVALEDIKGTPTGSMIENLLSLGLKEGENLENKAVNVEIIEEPLEAHSDEENEENPPPQFSKPSSMFFQIEELENAPQAAKPLEISTESTKVSMPTGEYRKVKQFQQGATDLNSPFITQVQETEYFVSTPDDNLSEHEESGFASYEQYAVAHDISAEDRYWQEEPMSSHGQSFADEDIYRTTHVHTSMRTTGGEHRLARDSFPECIIEEEVEVPHGVQESVLEILKEDAVDPKQQLKGALDHLQGKMSDNLKEEFEILNRNGQEGSDNVAVDIRKVQQSSDSGLVTIVAEINVPQNLEDSGLWEKQNVESSEEQIMSGRQFANPEMHPGIRGKGGEKSLFSSGDDDREFTVKVGRNQDVRVQGMSWVSESEEPESTSTGESVNEVNKTVKHIKLSPTEKSFTFQMDVTKVTSTATSSGPHEAQ
ncbi:SYNEM protein, partial [Amia calva]|nr:SYNEM protein [Amia calva]